MLANVGPIGPILASKPSSSVAFVSRVLASESRSALESAVREDQVVASQSRSALARAIREDQVAASVSR